VCVPVQWGGNDFANKPTRLLDQAAELCKWLTIKLNTKGGQLFPSFMLSMNDESVRS